ncbi:integral membrane protein [Phlyctema vagabunda]|uniref:Integral membrane protein n=1 Tax=Phlyctema vagabunda TaxID=108571 RepID=A0ABR4PUA8_9HELO
MLDLIRRFISEPPEARTFRDDKPTLLVSWWCTAYAITIILVRVCGRYVRTEKLFRDDGIMLLAMIPLLIRMAFVHVILLYGTNNTITTGLTDEDIQHRELGSQLVLAARIMYAAYLWAIKYSVSMFLQTLTGHVWQRSHHAVLRYVHIVLAVTFLATVVSDLAACQPFTHYWQVVPDPGPKCRQGFAHFLTLTISNIITSLVLVLFPIPMILKSRLSTNGKISIILRLALPLIGIFFTIGQITTVLHHAGDQQVRSLLASIDIFIATATSNAVVLGSLLQDKGYKKTKYKYHDASAGAELQKIKTGAATAAGTDKARHAAAARNRWGSDEDLIRSTSDRSSEHAAPIGLDTLAPLQKARLQEIHVNQTWEVQVEVEEPHRGASRKKDLVVQEVREVQDP